MNIKPIISIAMLVLQTLLADLGAQGIPLPELLKQWEAKYGTDARLVNGEKYFYSYGRADGHPFFDDEKQMATVILRGQKFPGQQIRFDIYNKQIILEYADANDAPVSLVLPSTWLEAFSYGGRSFRRMDGPGGLEDYMQVIFDGPVSCFYAWHKLYQLNLNSGQQSYYFSDPVREAYLLIDGRFHAFRKNGSFVRCFPKTQQKAIKGHLRQAGIKVQRATDLQMKQVLEFCNTTGHEIP